MTGSTRLTISTASSVRAPYSAPQATAPTTLPPARNFDPETGAAIRLPAPFIPREFRASMNRYVTVVPPVKHVEEIDVATNAVPDNSTSIAQLFDDSAAASTDFSSFIESHDVGETESTAASELPWIDAFAVEAPEPEEMWPMGEAGKRLNELTQSLTSLDASRERMQAERLSAEAPSQPVDDVPMSMWNEEEWIDIMPTAPIDVPAQDELPRATTQREVSLPDVAANELLAIQANADSAARALEGLAQRVRAGEVRVPAFPTELGQEAMLAGLLASMLGWRQ